VTGPARSLRNRSLNGSRGCHRNDRLSARVTTHGADAARCRGRRCSRRRNDNRRRREGGRRCGSNRRRLHRGRRRQHHRGWRGDARTGGAGRSGPRNDRRSRLWGSPVVRPASHPVGKRVSMCGLGDCPGEHQGAPSQQQPSHGSDRHFSVSGLESRYSHLRVSLDEQQRSRRASVC
jgi:hypothetical protein